MLRHGLILMAAAVVTGDTVGPGAIDAQTPASFALCDRPPPAIQKEFDYRTLRALDWDVGGDVMTCGADSDCISFPIVFAVPPRLPQPGETVRWSVAGHDFSMHARENAREEYEIAAVGHPARGGGAYRGEDLHLTYDLRRGLTSYRGEDGKLWTLCRGRLTFEDLHQLRPRLVPEFRHNPDIRQRPDVDDNFVLDTNITLPPRP